MASEAISIRFKISKLRQTQWENNCKLQIVKCANKKGSIVPNEFSCLAEGSSIIIVCTTLHHYLMPPSAPIFKSPQCTMKSQFSQNIPTPTLRRAAQQQRTCPLRFERP